MSDQQTGHRVVVKLHPNTDQDEFEQALAAVPGARKMDHIQALRLYLIELSPDGPTLDDLRALVGVESADPEGSLKLPDTRVHVTSDDGLYHRDQLFIGLTDAADLTVTKDAIAKTTGVSSVIVISKRMRSLYAKIDESDAEAIRYRISVIAGVANAIFPAIRRPAR